MDVTGIGIQEIGPYEFQIGSQKFLTEVKKIIILPKKEIHDDFEIITKSDPNQTGLTQIKIQYKIVYDPRGVAVIESDHPNLPKGIIFKSGSSSVSNGFVNCDFTFENINSEDIILTKDNFKDIPSWIKFPKIVLQAK